MDNCGDICNTRHCRGKLSEFRKILGVAMPVDTAPVFCDGERKAQLGGFATGRKGPRGRWKGARTVVIGRGRRS
jgi:hypothetical protein